MSSAYEKLRLKNIERNEQLLAKLGIKQAKKDFNMITKKKTNHKISKKRKATGPPSGRVLRSSRRLKGEEPEIKLNEKEVQLVKEQPNYISRKAKDGPIEFEEALSEGTSKAANQELLKILRNLTSKSNKDDSVSEINGSIVSKEKGKQNKTMDSLSVKENMFVKVVPERIYCMGFHPSDRALVVVGDKTGRLGFFDADKGGNEAVVVYEPHVRPISDLKWHPSDWNKLFTCSYEGKVRCMDIEKTMFSDILSNKQFFTALEVGGEGNTLYIADGEGQLSFLDIRSSKITYTYSLHNKRIYMIHRNPVRGYELLTCSGDQTISIWDVRKLQKANPIQSYKHDLAVTSARFSPISGDKLVSVCNDNYIRIWEKISEQGLSDKNIKKIRHRNLTGRWVSNLQAHWHPKSDDLFMVGSMERAIDVFSSSGKRIAALVDDKLTSIPAINVFHNSRTIIASGNASGKVYVWS